MRVSRRAVSQEPTIEHRITADEVGLRVRIPGDDATGGCASPICHPDRLGRLPAVLADEEVI